MDGAAPLPEVGAGCVSSARPDLWEGWPATAIPIPTWLAANDSESTWIGARSLMFISHGLYFPPADTHLQETPLFRRVRNQAGNRDTRSGGALKAGSSHAPVSAYSNNASAARRNSRSSPSVKK